MPVPGGVIDATIVPQDQLGHLGVVKASHPAQLIQAQASMAVLPDVREAIQALANEDERSLSNKCEPGIAQARRGAGEEEAVPPGPLGAREAQQGLIDRHQWER